MKTLAKPRKSRCSSIVKLLLLLTMAFFVVDLLVVHGKFAYFMISKPQRKAYVTLKRLGCEISVFSPTSVMGYCSGTKKPELRVTLRKKNENDSLLEVKDSLTALNPIYIHGHSLTDEELVAIENIANVKFLDLARSPITDKSIPLLLSLPKLRYLTVDDTRITENGLTQIARDIEPERELTVSALHCEMSQELYDELKKINPNVILSVRVITESPALIQPEIPE